MYRIDVYKRNRDGNRGNFIFSSKYETKEQADKAKETLIKNSTRTNLAPRDIECCKSVGETKIIEYNLLYSDENGNMVLKPCKKEVKVASNPEFKLWKLKGFVVANPVKE